MYLVDTNVWLERLLNQERSVEVGEFLERISAADLAISDFTFHSICVILTRLARGTVLLDFVQDVLVDGAVNVVSIRPGDTGAVVSAIDAHKLDFDDAYQYVAAQQHGLTLVSFDDDFNRTDNGKKTPGEVLREHAGGSAG